MFMLLHRGSVWCPNSPQLDCISLYSEGLLERWDCGSNFTSEPCEDTPEDCDTQRLALLNNRQDLNEALKIYPNPSNGKIYINAPVGDFIETIKVFDFSGQLINLFDYSEKEISKQLELDISTEVSGMYLLHIETVNEQVLTKRVVIE